MRRVRRFSKAQYVALLLATGPSSKPVANATAEFPQLRTRNPIGLQDATLHLDRAGAL